MDTKQHSPFRWPKHAAGIWMLFSYLHAQQLQKQVQQASNQR